MVEILDMLMPSIFLSNLSPTGITGCNGEDGYILVVAFYENYEFIFIIVSTQKLWDKALFLHDAILIDMEL